MPDAQLAYEQVEGWRSVVDWFGHWPSFHDAEIVDLSLSRSHPSVIRLRAWSALRFDEKGGYEYERDSLVRFECVDENDLELADFSGQNVIMYLEVESGESSALRLFFQAIYGIGGWIQAARVSVSIEEWNAGAGV